MWLGNIALWNQYTDSTRGEILYTKQRQNMTWTKYQSNTNAIISNCQMCNGPIPSMQIMHIDLPGNT